MSIDTWKAGAVCAQTDPEIFFPNGGGTKKAKLICLGCDVREQCLQWALEHHERYGVWGGTSERERRGILRGITKPTVPEQHCEVCGRALFARGGRGPARFCSEDCRSQVRRPQPKRSCKTCGSDLPGGRGRYVYCSTTCRLASQCRTRNINTCRECGVTFKANGRRCYCGSACRHQAKKTAESVGAVAS